MAGEAAGFWRRFAAAFIDGLLLGVAQAILRFIVGFSLGEVIGLVISFGYFTYFHGSTGQTPGDAALGIRVLDLDDQSVIGYGRALVRALMSVVSAVVFFLGYLWMLWDPRKQTWHDKVAHSLPIREAR
jgi:uncharacterized RDD family membrane protein YckC